jgi:hypothetical protein
MTRLYYRDLCRRAGAIEALFVPRREILPTLIFRDEDGLPVWVCIPTKFDWVRTQGEPIPAKILALGGPEALPEIEPEDRAAFTTRLPAKEGTRSSDR